MLGSPPTRNSPGSSYTPKPGRKNNCCRITRTPNSSSRVSTTQNIREASFGHQRDHHHNHHHHHSLFPPHDPHPHLGNRMSCRQRREQRKLSTPPTLRRLTRRRCPTAAAAPKTGGAATTTCRLRRRSRPRPRRRRCRALRTPCPLGGRYARSELGREKKETAQNRKSN